MKIKLIGSTVVAIAALASGAQAIGQEVKLDSNSAGMVVRKYTGMSATPFFNQFAAKLQEDAKAGNTAIGKGAAKYLAQLASGNSYGYIHQTTRSVTERELQTGIQAETATDAPMVVGQTTIDQVCQKKTSNTVTVMGTTYVAEVNSKGALAWVMQRSITSLMTTCPDTTI
ncbi:hypothetical protein [Dyella sp. GSA-30]|uniref:hypothetical protein n=1 Tax=Dyella sp. GSA-30 TaxID=2994496 RepID=UPI0024906FEB|nr:hypothetical protein [Dyella sp. GSA-30]BDU22137.1 hypothetical protein DYGSA30_35940 [Dyella sp. GSA-30]